MDNTYWVYIIGIVFMLVLSGFFSASETALTSANVLRMKQQAKAGHSRAQTVVRLLDSSQEMISAILIGNNVVNIGSSAMATVLFSALFGGKGPLVATIIMTILVLIFGEVIPKSIAQEKSEAMSLSVAPIIEFVTQLFKPLVLLLSKFTNFIMNLFFPMENEEPTITGQELKTLVDMGTQEGVFDPSENMYIHNVIDFSSATAMDIMRPRTSLVAYDINSSPGEFYKFLKENRYSRIPVYEDNIDNIIGMLYMKDIVRAKVNKDGIDLSELLREPYFISESATADKIFHELKSRSLSIAVVVDEYAGTSGIVTIEDILEKLVGRIDDEYDLEESEIIALDKHIYLINPETKIDKFNELFKVHLESIRADSIGGLVIEVNDAIPEVGTTVDIDGMVFKITGREGQKITEMTLDMRSRRAAQRQV